MMSSDSLLHSLPVGLHLLNLNSVCEIQAETERDDEHDGL